MGQAKKKHKTIKDPLGRRLVDEFAQNLRAARTSQHLTQDRLGYMLNTRYSRISDFERSKGRSTSAPESSSTCARSTRGTIPSRPTVTHAPERGKSVTKGRGYCHMKPRMAGENAAAEGPWS